MASLTNVARGNVQKRTKLPATSSWVAMWVPGWQDVDKLFGLAA